MVEQDTGKDESVVQARRFDRRIAVEVAMGGTGAIIMLVLALHAFHSLEEPSRTIMGVAAFASFLLTLLSIAVRLVWGFAIDSRLDRIEAGIEEIKAQNRTIIKQQEEIIRLLKIIADAVVKDKRLLTSGSDSAT